MAPATWEYDAGISAVVLVAPKALALTETGKLTVPVWMSCPVGAVSVRSTYAEPMVALACRSAWVVFRTRCTESFQLGDWGFTVRLTSSNVAPPPATYWPAPGYGEYGQAWE